jgi:phosphoglycolate phosphatase
MRLARPQAVVFDLDGTLLDTLDDIADAANQVLQSLGLATHDRDRYRFYVGEGVSVLFSRALPEDRRTEAQVAECVARWRDVYGANWHVRSRIYDGMSQVLETLSAQDLATGVLSNKPHEFTCKCIEHFFPRHPFRAVFGARAGVPRKPDPAGLREIADRLGIAPGQCVYVGDSAVDVQTARAAGSHPVGVLWGFRDREELEAAGAATVLQHPLDLLSWLAAQGALEGI